MSLKLHAAVGRADVARVQNKKVDVTLVQALLKRVANLKSQPRYDPGKIDGKIGKDASKSATVKAILAFQTHFLKMGDPDSVVDKTPKAGNMLDTLIKNAFVVKPFNLKVVRSEEHSKSIIGTLFLNGTRVCHTLELPWKFNKRNESCVPAGTYSAYLRYNSDKSKREWVPELKSVPMRTAIQIHIGNYPSDIEGCTLVGLSKATNFVGASEDAFQLLQDKIFGEGFTRAQIRAAKPKHPTFSVTYTDPPGRRWKLRRGEMMA